MGPPESGPFGLIRKLLIRPRDRSPHHEIVGLKSREIQSPRRDPTARCVRKAARSPCDDERAVYCGRGRAREHQVAGGHSEKSVPVGADERELSVRKLERLIKANSFPRSK